MADWGFQLLRGDSFYPCQVSFLLHWTMGGVLLDPVSDLKQPFMGPGSFNLSRAWSHWFLCPPCTHQKSSPQLLGLTSRSKNSWAVLVSVFAHHTDFEFSLYFCYLSWFQTPLHTQHFLGVRFSLTYPCILKWRMISWLNLTPKKCGGR